MRKLLVLATLVVAMLGVLTPSAQAAKPVPPSCTVTATDTSVGQDGTEYTVTWSFFDLRRGQTANGNLDGIMRFGPLEGVNGANPSGSHVVSAGSPGDHAADGIITNRRDVVLATCGPVLFTVNSPPAA